MEVAPFNCPIRDLHAAVLERAVRDLQKNVDRNTRRDAIKWFNTYFLDKDDEVDPYIFSCKAIVTFFQFRSELIDFLKGKVAEAEQDFWDGVDDFDRH